MGRGLFTPIFVCVPPPRTVPSSSRPLRTLGPSRGRSGTWRSRWGVWENEWGGHRIQIGVGGDLRTPPPSPKCFWGSFPTDVSLHPFLCLPPQIFALRVPEFFGGFSPLNSVCVPQFHGPPLPPTSLPPPPHFLYPPPLKIEGEMSSKPPASLDRILSDCRALREENALLAARIRNA